MDIHFYEFHNMLNKQQIKQINKFIVKNFDEKASNQNGAFNAENKSLKNVDTSLIYWFKIKDFLNSPYQFILSHIVHELGYLIYPFNDYRHVFYNIYDSKYNHSYDYHIDSVSDDQKNSNKGTILINLSEEKYTGGRFLIWFNGQEIHIPHLDIPGNIIYLKPHIFHKVEPVLSGVRKSLSIFLTGPKWR